MSARTDDRAGAEVATANPAQPDPGGGARGSGWMLRATVIGTLIGLVIGGIGAFAIWRHKPAGAVCQPIQCTYLTPTVAPGFTLTDQRGHTVSLSGLRGKAVVLSFLDPRCSDVCPVLAAEFVQANKLLGSASGGVAFVGVNVNQAHEAVGDVRGFTATHGMSALRNWYFLTGSTTSLEAVWARWGIAVEPKANGSVVHTAVVYFLDPQGRIQYTAFPVSSTAVMPTWGTTIAATARHLEAST